jgi:hypothetical protein
MRRPRRWPRPERSYAMLWRHLCLVRAWSAAGLVSGLLMFGVSLATAQTSPPVDPEKSASPAQVATETVELLEANQAGDLNLVARGQGQDRVLVTIRNTSSKRLNVIIPPGLVAAGAPGQAGRGLQSMGLAAPSNRLGSFGQFQSIDRRCGLKSVPVEDSSRYTATTVPIGERVDLTIPAVCLNFGLPTPSPRDTFTLMDVEDYSTDPRVRKSLRSLALLGTSQGIAQAVMWRVCNNLSFETMGARAGKIMNEYEIALAARFVEVLDASTESELVDPASLTEGRVFLRIQGEGALARDAKRLNDQFESLHLLGLPVRVLDSDELPSAPAPSLLVKVVLTDTKIGETRGRVGVSYCSQAGQWLPLGTNSFEDGSSLAVLDGATLSRGLDRAIAAAFVTVKPAHRSTGSTTLKVVNRLPFTLAALTVKAGNSAGAPTVPFEGIGVGPARSALLPIQAATASVDRVELNGL